MSITLNPSALVTHTLPTGQSFMRPATLNPEGINFEDCERDILLDFPLVVAGSASAAAGYALYAFAGTNCDEAGNVVPNAASSTCWPIVDGPIAYNLGDGGFTVPIRARQILAQLRSAVKERYTDVATTDDSMCHLQPTDAEVGVSVYFVFATDPTLAKVGGTGVAQLNADMAAAPPPASLAVRPANGGLLPTWTASNDADLVGYNVYYLPVGSAADAGASCTGAFPPAEVLDSGSGASDAGATASAASLADLSMQPEEAVAGQYPFVAVSGRSSTSATLPALTNDQEYVVAIATTDAFGNVGALSTGSMCQTPSASAEPLPDDAGGSGGGGCAIDGAGKSANGAGAAALFAAAALVLARRRKRNARG